MQKSALGSIRCRFTVRGLADAGSSIILKNIMRRSERAEALGTVSLEWQREIILKFLVQRLAGVVDTGILTNIYSWLQAGYQGGPGFMDPR